MTDFGSIVARVLGYDEGVEYDRRYEKLKSFFIEKALESPEFKDKLKSLQEEYLDRFSRPKEEWKPYTLSGRRKVFHTFDPSYPISEYTYTNLVDLAKKGLMPSELEDLNKNLAEYKSAFLKAKGIIDEPERQKFLRSQEYRNAIQQYIYDYLSEAYKSE